MANFDHRKYKPFTPVAIKHRQWPDQVIEQAPGWCSVDLRDGNQALLEPMTVAQKERLFQLLIKVGFKEIEVGFPAASQPDFEFVRRLIERDMIPADVTIQVLVQAREALIARTFEALQGVRNAIVHVYNSTSTVQREQVFGLDREGVREIAVNGARLLKQYAVKYPATNWTFEYSPESFTGTELEYAVDVCDAVMAEWQPTPERPAIINLPATVEMTTPNVYADQIEWFCSHVQNREAMRVSVHTHNDRGCAVAAAELAVMAGADRVEGTLLGNGERTGNMDIVTMAMNLYSQGVNPQLDFSAMDEIAQTVQACTGMPLHPRHPYAGELVFTAFSGSHQDAINKCLTRYDATLPWEVAYLPIDPADVGRSYEEVIRINSQSGKGGVAWVMAREYGLELPRWLQIEFSALVQKQAEDSESEVDAAMMWRLFQQAYLREQQGFSLDSYQLSRKDGMDTLQARVNWRGSTLVLAGTGGGVVDAFAGAMSQHLGEELVVVSYSEHALSQASDADAICYVQVNLGGQRFGAVATSSDIVSAPLKAILAAVNQAHSHRRGRAA